MNFWFKKKKIVVDVFNYHEGVANLFPLERASKHKPDWLKDVSVKVSRPNNDPDAGSIRSCPGFLDYYSTSFMLPLWSDLQINSDTTGYKYSFAQEGNVLDPHSHELMGNQFMDFHHGKIISPWLLRENTGINWMFSAPTWNDPDLLGIVNVLPGVVNFKYQHSTNINMLFPKKKYKLNLFAGQDMMMLTPLTENEVVLKTHVVSTEEWGKIHQKSIYQFTFNGIYRKAKSIRQKRESDSKCPFGFGK
jgi:hypothetical protein